MKTHDQRAYEDAFEQRQRDYYTEQALKDCTEAITQTDEGTIIETLADIGNRAIRIAREGDTDDKLAFVDEVCTTMLRLIDKQAKAQASLDYERRERER